MNLDTTTTTMKTLRPTTLPARLSFAAALSAGALAVQATLQPLLGPDSFQVFLGAVAIATMVAGAESGVLALGLSGIAKLCFFVLPAAPVAGARQVLAHILVFMCVGGLICWLGDRLHTSERRIKVLTGFLPICAGCKQIRDATGEWRQIECYIREHSEAEFSHGLCPACTLRYFG